MPEHYYYRGSLARRAVALGSMPYKESATSTTPLILVLEMLPLKTPLIPGLDFFLAWMKEQQGHGAGQTCREPASNDLVQQSHWCDKVLSCSGVP